MLRHRPLWLLCAVVLAAGCGKDPNVHDEARAEFPHVLPAAPEALGTTIAPAWTSGHPLAATEEHLFAVDEDNGDLVLLDRRTLEVERAVHVGERPEQVVVGPDGTAWVTVRWDGTVARVAPGADAPADVIQVGSPGSQPYGLALSPDGARLYVTLHGDDALAVLDAESGEILQTVDAGHLPRAVVTGTRGTVHVVQHRGPVLRWDVGADGRLLEDHAAGLEAGQLRLLTPSDAAFDPGRSSRMQATRALAAAVHPADGRILVAHVQAEPGTGDGSAGVSASTASSGGGGYGSSGGSPGLGLSFDPPQRPVEAAVTALTPAGEPERLVPSPPVRDPEAGDPLTAMLESPSDIRHHPTHSLAFVTGEGTDTAVAFNTSVTDPLAHPVARIAVGDAPRGVAFAPDGTRAYVLNGDAFTISDLDLAPLLEADRRPQRSVSLDVPMAVPADGAQPAPHEVAFMEPLVLAHAREVPFAEDPRPEAVRRGSRVFHDARNERLSHAGRFSCNTCHVDGGEDGLVWFITDGPRQTIALAGRLEGTAPFNWTGTKPELQHNMEQTVARMGGLGLTDQELADLEQYLLYLPAPPNPHRRDEGLTDLQARGKQLFHDPQVGCSGCHAGPALTNGGLHDVGTATDEERALREVAIQDGAELPPPGTYNTPSLRDVWYTAPYLHNGSAPTLMDVLDRTATTMGYTAHLSQADKEALVAWLKTL